MTSKKQKKATQEAAKKKNIMNAGIILIVILAVIWIATSAQDNKAIPPADSPPVNVLPKEEDTPEAEEVVPPTDLPQDNDKQYDEYPPMTIDTDATYLATVKMANGGEFIIELYADKSPITVNSFVFLARDGYFDGTTFHRVLDGFMAQGGDPTGTGMGGPGYEFVNEDSDLTFDKEGIVAMANAGPDTNGSQFFITFVPLPQLDGGYTIFGQVTEGMDVVNEITRRDPMEYPDFEGDMIESITIEEK